MMRTNRIKHFFRHTLFVRCFSCRENVTYLVLWGVIFLAPLLSLYAQTINDANATFTWNRIFATWREFAIYLLIFLIHNFLLLPLLMDEPNGKTGRRHGHKHLKYISILAVIIAAFTIYQCENRPEMPPAPHPTHTQDNSIVRKPELNHDQEQSIGPHHNSVGRPPYPPPPIIGEHDIMAVIMLILMFGANIGIKWYFRSQEYRRRMSELEQKNLEQQLEYLKYQLNPHFLMNSLNNIHALIDIEPPKAQEAIIQLSKILRYVLYESNRKRVLMSQEVEFTRNYVQLMRMRYSDKLRFTTDIPDKGTDVYVPPMLFISFVENAFKHGVSYQEESFIAIDSKRYQDEDGGYRLRWTCKNSKHRQQDASSLPRQGGMGLVNVRQRLSMIFNDDFTLDVCETENTYEVIMDIPLETHIE